LRTIPPISWTSKWRWPIVRERLRQHVVERLAILRALAQGVGLAAQLGVLE
jgi:hypothetical protein